MADEFVALLLGKIRDDRVVEDGGGVLRETGLSDEIWEYLVHDLIARGSGNGVWVRCWSVVENGGRSQMRVGSGLYASWLSVYARFATLNQTLTLFTERARPLLREEGFPLDPPFER
jgi:hypothetical protein